MKKSSLSALNDSIDLLISVTDPIRHVVVLMLENRSFDHLLGSMKSLYPGLRGIDPNNPGVNREGTISYEQKPNAVFQLPYGVDPKHELAYVLTQLDYNGPCGGFIHDFIRNYPDKKASAPQVMAYFDRLGPNRLPVLHTLAESFTICDQWFCSVPGPTWPNRSQGRLGGASQFTFATEFGYIAAMKSVSQNLLDEVTVRLAAEFQPEQVWLFGSHAWGQPDEGSDLDLLVVVPRSDETPVGRAQRAHRCLRGVNVAADILVKTRAEVERFRHVRASLENLILNKGRLVYG